MTYKVGRIFWFDTVYGFATVESEGERIFLHENFRIQPYPTVNGVKFTHTTSLRHASEGVDVRLKVQRTSKGLRAKEWMYQDDFEKSKRRVKELRRHNRLKSRRKRQFSGGVSEAS